MLRSESGWCLHRSDPNSFGSDFFDMQRISDGGAASGRMTRTVPYNSGALLTGDGFRRVARVCLCGAADCLIGSHGHFRQRWACGVEKRGRSNVKRVAVWRRGDGGRAPRKRCGIARRIGNNELEWRNGRRRRLKISRSDPYGFESRLQHERLVGCGGLLFVP